jgi:hypothetical protein
LWWEKQVPPFGRNDKIESPMQSGNSCPLPLTLMLVSLMVGTAAPGCPFKRSSKEFSFLKEVLTVVAQKESCHSEPKGGTCFSPARATAADRSVRATPGIGMANCNNANLGCYLVGTEVTTGLTGDCTKVTWWVCLSIGISDCDCPKYDLDLRLNVRLIFC